MSKYTRTITQTISGEDRGCSLAVDVYDVLRAFSATDPAIQHAIKKLLCTGIRGHKNSRQDLEEAVQSIHRALDAIRAEEVPGKPIGAEFKVVPDVPPQSDCPFSLGDLIQHKEHGLKCRVEKINRYKKIIWVRDLKSNQPFYIAKTGWRYYEPARDGSSQPQVCPFSVGDVVEHYDRAYNATKWQIIDITSDRLVVVSNDPYRQPSHIERAFWRNYHVAASPAIDNPQPTC